MPNETDTKTANQPPSCGAPGSPNGGLVNNAAKPPDLLLCPFCGGKDLIPALYNTPSVVCQTCLATGPAAQRLIWRRGPRPENLDAAKAEAAALWNARPKTPELVALRAVADAARNCNEPGDWPEGELARALAILDGMECEAPRSENGQN